MTRPTHVFLALDKLRNRDEITSETDVGFLFIFKACKQAHRKLCNCLHSADDGQKGMLVSDIINFMFLGIGYFQDTHP